MITPIQVYAGLAAAAVLATSVGGGVWYVKHLQHVAAAAQVEAAFQHGAATVATGQAELQSDTAAIADRGAQRGARLAATHQENAHALSAAPGAGQPLDPGFVQRLNDGLCQYAAYADDPGCTGLRVGDPGELPQAGPADAPH